MWNITNIMENVTPIEKISFQNRNFPILSPLKTFILLDVDVNTLTKVTKCIAYELHMENVFDQFIPKAVKKGLNIFQYFC